MKKHNGIISMIILFTVSVALILTGCGKDNSEADTPVQDNTPILTDAAVQDIHEETKTTEPKEDVIEITAQPILIVDPGEDSDDESSQEASGPQILSAVSTDGSSVTASWAAIDGAAVYQLLLANEANTERISDTEIVYKYITSNSWVTDKTELTVSDIEPGIYRVCIRSYSDTERNNLLTDTNECKVMYVAVGDFNPAAPVITSAEGGVGTVTLSWSAVDGASLYKIFVSTENEGEYISAGAWVTDKTEITISDVEAGEHNIRIKSFYDAEGNNILTDLSECDPVKVTVAGESKVPVIISAEGGVGTVTVSWTAVKGAGLYKVYVSGENAGEYVTTNDWATDQTEITISGVDAGEHDILIRSYSDAEGNNILTDLGDCTPVKVTVAEDSNVPVIISAEGGAGTVTVSWTAVEGAGLYKVYVSGENAGEFVTTNDWATDQTEITISGVDAGEHDILIRSYSDAEGNNILTDLGDCTPVKVTVAEDSNVPVIISAEGGAGTVTVSWTAVEGAGLYKVYVSGENAGEFVTTNDWATDQTEITISGVDPGEHDIRIKSFTDTEGQNVLTDLD